MKTSNAGIMLIKSFEGLKLVAYKCPAGIWTIGYGHTGPDVTPGQVITQAQADALLARDLERFEAGVSRLVSVQLNQNQFDALVSFAYNLGLGALQGSTLLRLLNAGDYAGAAAQFPRWNKASGKELPGLTRRRAAEQALFLGK
ncbi:lysozyme [Chromobacterium haemolyticum]|uniref:lysozyme n=1 Tax=Chromobacterium haemolyticum TaxID=394935 RepID=UPI004055B500